MTRFSVWLAADAFLYLPIFALKEFGILSRVIDTFRDAGEDVADAEIVISTIKGDKECLTKMVASAQAEAGTDTIHIAVCDPLAGFEVDEGAKEVRILGGFIKRPSFWILAMEPEQAGPVYLACPDPNYETAYNLAKAIECEKPIIYKPMWSVIDELAKEENKDRNLHALTPDILGMVRLQRQENGRKARVVSCLAQQKEYADFLTTGLATHKRYVTHKAKELAVFREAVRTACFLVNAAEVPTTKLVQELSQRPEFLEQLRVREGENPMPLSEEEAQLVTAQIIDNNLLASDLSISPRQWHGAVKARGWDRKTAARASTFYLQSRAEHIARPFLYRWAKNTMTDLAEYIEDDHDQRRVLGALLGVFLLTFAHVRIVGATALVPDAQVHWSSTLISWTANIGVVVSLMAIVWSLARRPLQRSGIVNYLAPLVRGDPDVLELALVSSMSILVLGLYYALVSVGANPMSWGEFLVGVAMFLVPPFGTFLRNRLTTR